MPPTEHLPEMKLDIGHVLFIDIVEYSKGLISEQSESLQKLKEIVRGTEQFRVAEAEGKLLRLPTGDGGALVFRNNPEAPVLCAMEITKALQKSPGSKEKPQLRLRMGIHSGPVNEVSDLNEQANIAGAGINIAQRVMDCGDTGHILLSRHIAEDLEHYPRWQANLHDLGECDVKHGVRVSVVNLYNDEVGNPALPEKFRKTAASAAQPTLPKSTKSYLVPGIVLLAALIILAVLFGPGFFRSRNQGAAKNTAQSNDIALTPISAKSIAVLPFDNLSSDKENAYFAEGIQDEILTRLAKIADLKVISRTSTQKYKSAPDNLREVGKQLGVANLLEGSVQKISNAVHVNVQLIRAATDAHLWAESYNRKLDDVFGVEAEVAGAIADQLKAKLTDAEEKAISDKPTRNVSAYDAYLRGLSIEHNRYGDSAYQEAAAAYANALKLDPNFAVAWARLAAIRSYLHFNGIDTNTNSAAAVKEAADRAIALQPELGEAWIAQGSYLYRVQRDYAGALRAYNEALKRLPNSSFVFENMAIVERRLGLWKEAEAHFKKSADLDPRDFNIFLTMGGEFLNYLRRFDDAHAAVDRALEISPNDEDAIAAKADLFQSEGRLEEAAKQLARIPADSTADRVVLTRLSQAEDERRFDAGIALIKRKVSSLKPEEPIDNATKILLAHLGYCQEWAGRPDEARASFERALQALKPSAKSPVSSQPTGLHYFVASVYAGLGDKINALDQAHGAVEDFSNDAILKPTAETLLAKIQARFGDLDSAIAALPHLLEVPAGLNRADLRFDPMWDPLRKDPRFEKLCQEPTK
jgi:TolB-like protein/Tfp pilus assembly protein PilF/class 3 adenylate cyclase